MRIVPRNKSPQIAFFQTHLEHWLDNAAALGVDPARIAELAASIETARELMSAQTQAQFAAQSATSASNRASERMAMLGANIISQIRSTARVDGPKIYSLARLPMPDKASPIAPPGKPERLETRLTALGWVKMKWQCKNPRGSQGTQYRVSRSLDSISGPFEFLGVVGKKTFTDDTIPHGTVTATYEIQAARSTAVGPVSRFNVAFNSLARNLGMAGLGPIQPRKVA